VEEFSLEHRRSGDAAIVAPVGEIDVATVVEVEAALRAAAREAGHVVLDLRAVTFMDSAGLRLVVQTSQALERFSVVRGPGEVQRLFALVGLDQRMAILDRPPGDA
jgi:anti-anti-sigma factor